MTPCQRNTVPFLPATPSSLSYTLNVLFELPRSPSRALNLASYITSGTTEKQGHFLLSRARSRGRCTPSRTTIAKLDCAFVKNPLVFVDPKVGKGV